MTLENHSPNFYRDARQQTGLDTKTMNRLSIGNDPRGALFFSVMCAPCSRSYFPFFFISTRFGTLFFGAFLLFFSHFMNFLAQHKRDETNFRLSFNRKAPEKKHSTRKVSSLRRSLFLPQKTIYVFYLFIMFQLDYG